MFPSLILKNQFGEQSSNFVEGGSLYLKFKVDAANVNGYGVSGFRSNGLFRAYMHTSQTPATGSPNPAVGFLSIQTLQNYQGFYFAGAMIAAPVGSSTSTSTTNHAASVIAALGTASLAQWQAVGLPVGVTPAVGQAFIATASQAIGGSATVAASTVSNNTKLELVGDPDLTLSSTSVGAQMIFQFLNPTLTTNAYGQPYVPAQPTDGSVVFMKFEYSQLVKEG